MIPVVLIPSDICELSVRVDPGLTRIGNGLTDWKNGPCPSDSGLEDGQRSVENCRIGKRLSLNWSVGNGLVDWSEIGLALGWHGDSGLAVCWLDWPVVGVTVCAKSSSVETLRPDLIDDLFL